MTEYTDLYDLLLMSIKDYSLDALFATSQTDLNTYLQGFLMLAIPEFTNCQQDLSNRDDVVGQFNFNLTDKEKSILVKLITIQWLLKEIQDVTQIKNILNDTDFKMFSNANNLKAKQDYFATIREIVKQDMFDYGLKNIDWASWKIGDFD